MPVLRIGWLASVHKLAGPHCRPCPSARPRRNEENGKPCHLLPAVQCHQGETHLQVVRRCQSICAEETQRMGATLLGAGEGCRAARCQSSICLILLDPSGLIPV